MDPLTLDLDDVKVDSFVPDADAASRSGTVHGHIQGDTQNFANCFQTNVDCGDYTAECSDDCYPYTEDPSDCIVSGCGSCIEDGCGELTPVLPCMV